MKFYIAAKFSDKERVKKAYLLIKEAGHAITHEWVHNKQSYPFHQDPSYTAQCAMTDINGVLAADVFVLFSNEEPSMGASAELGAAIGSFITFKRPQIFVIGPHFGTNFAFWHPAVTQKDSLEGVLTHIAQNDKKNSLLRQKQLFNIE